MIAAAPAMPAWRQSLRCALLAVSLDRRKHRINVSGLLQELADAKLVGSRAIVVSREHHHGDHGERAVAKLLLAKLPPVHNGHVYVEEDDARRFSARCTQRPQRGLTVSCAHDRSSRCFDEQPESFAYVGIIFDDQNVVTVTGHRARI
jgi:hypothetical protein